jgi:hypothetical protein
MMQMVHFDVLKVDLGVAYVAMTIPACFKHTFQVFHLFQTYIANVSSGCFKSRSSLAHVAAAPVASRLPQDFGSYLMLSSLGAPRPFLSSTSPLFPSLSSPPSRRGSLSSMGKPYTTNA